MRPDATSLFTSSPSLTSNKAAGIDWWCLNICTAEWLFSMLLSRLDLGQLTKRPAGGAQPTIPSAQAFSSIPVCHQTLPVTQPACEKMERNYIPTDCQFPAHVAHRVWKHLITRTGVVQWLVCFNLISVTVLTSEESQPKIHSQGLHFN